MKKIKLYGKFGKDKYALVDNLDIGLVSKLKWWVSKKKNCFYVIRELFHASPSLRGKNQKVSLRLTARVVPHEFPHHIS